MPGHDEEILVPLGEVQRLALSGARPLPPVQMPLDEALGCVLAADVVTSEDVPPFANTAMDGYAVRAVDTAGAPVELQVVGVLGAGAASIVGVGPGEAIQIMTGAPIPAGADGVAIVERTEAIADDDGDGGGLGRVRILEPVVAGMHLRAPGSDLRAGSVAVPAGTMLSPAHIGVLASVGAGLVTVHPRPRVGVMVTGDELVELAADGSALPLAPGQIRESNRHALLATLRRDGFAAVDLGLAADTEEAVTAGLEPALGACDAVLTSGGVSKGAFDYVKVVLGKLGASAGGGVHELSVALRPAKPLVISWLPSTDGTSRLLPVFGLPGNPVSSLVSYQAIALPVLRVLAGHRPAAPPSVPAVAAAALRRQPDGKTHLIRVQVRWRADGRLGARATSGQMSHQLAGMAAANGLAIVPDGDGFAEGERLEVIVFGPIEAMTEEADV
ncbi:MAG TPA: gephyrin-like molybdotransferase Glp [Acidimicrobiales bacterium]|nr:gephyrin-like molybdotransferase Glp [Acidimicrobiales bacterium]